MPLLNYTTTIRVDKTIGEIQRILGEHGAKATLTEYDDDHAVAAVSFQIRMGETKLAFRLPGRPEAVHVLLNSNRRIPAKFRTMDQARRVAWRIIRSWVQAQMALVETEMVKIGEVFLPYAVDSASGKTLYEKLEENGFSQLLALPPGQNEEVGR